MLKVTKGLLDGVLIDPDHGAPNNVLTLKSLRVTNISFLLRLSPLDKTLGLCELSK